jgi:rhomboid protease GluP
VNHRPADRDPARAAVGLPVITHDLTAFAEIYSSTQWADCEQRAFVLKAVGIEYVAGQHDERFVLLVPQADIATALDQLRHYEVENKPKPPPPRLKLHGAAWSGASAYAVLMIAVAYCAGANVGGFDWLQAGALTHAVKDGGEWWRTITALTLHADVAHLLGNLAFGIPYGFFAGQLLGVGRAWLSILLAAALGNLLDAALMSTHQTTIGASTAVFAMLGLVAAYSWRTAAAGRWAYRAAPLVAAVALLAITGVGGEQTDVVAHLAGFLAGAAVGTVQAHLPARRLDHRAVQIGAGLLTIAIVAAAWLTAL